MSSKWCGGMLMGLAVSMQEYRHVRIQYEAYR